MKTEKQIIKQHKLYAQSILAKWSFSGYNKEKWPNYKDAVSALEEELQEKLSKLRNETAILESKKEKAKECDHNNNQHERIRTSVLQEDCSNAQDSKRQEELAEFKQEEQILQAKAEQAKSASQDEQGRTTVLRTVLEKVSRDAGLPDFDWHYTDMTIRLKPFQSKYTSIAWSQLYLQRHAAALINAGTGTGKTYMSCALIKRLQKEEWHTKINTLSCWPYLIVTKSSVVDQFYEVAKYQFNLDMQLTLITSYDQLRSNFGSQFIREETVIRQGEPHIIYHWRKFMYPMFIIWDECHALKNEDSQQSKIAQAFNNLTDPNIKQIHMSATPFTRVADAKCFVVACRADII